MKYSLIICFSFLLFESFGQFHDIEGLKKKGRDSILRYTEQILLDRAIYNYPSESENIKVMANSYEIIVYYKMGFKKNTTDFSYENYDLSVSLTEEQITVFPYSFGSRQAEYELSAKDKEAITFVMQDYPFPFAEDERIRIKDKGSYYEMTCSRGSRSGAECYSIDKKSGDRDMLWHEMPFDPGDDLPIPPEEVFYEIL
jgi:hypothetical protein